MKALGMIGVPWNPQELVLAAEDAARLGVRLCVVDTAAALRRVPRAADCDLLPVSALTVPVIAAALPEQEMLAIFSLSEQTLQVTAELRAALQHPATSPADERALVDKFCCREVLAAAGLTEVTFSSVAVSDLPAAIARLSLPVVLKPRALAGSNGVRFVADLRDLEDAMRDYDTEVIPAFGRDQVLVESFIPGVEISAEALVIEGKLTLLTLTDKINSGPPYFQECGHIIPSRHQELREPTTAYLQQVVSALGIHTAPIHAELKFDGQHCELVEINERFGGGGIVQLLSESLSFRPFGAYFAALLEGAAPVITDPVGFRGVGFFTTRTESPPGWKSFDFPRPDVVIGIDLDVQRAPKMSVFEGIRIRYWRPGSARFQSPDYTAVEANIRFLAAQLEQ